MARVGGGEREVQERLAVRAVLDDEEVERLGAPVARGADLDFEAVAVGARVTAFDPEPVGHAGRRSCVGARVEPERRRGGRSRLKCCGDTGRDRAHLDHVAQRDPNAWRRCLDDGLHLRDRHCA